MTAMPAEGRTSAALIGTGDWARAALVPALRSLPEVDLVACCSLDLASAEAFANEMGIPRPYADLDEMLAGEAGLNLVVISTPDDHHVTAVCKAQDASVNVFCEKPLAGSAADARELAERAGTTEMAATVGFSFRYSEAVQRIKQDLDTGALGAPWLLELHEHNPQFHPTVGRPLNWKGDPARVAGGALFEYGSHVVDLAAWLLGPVAGVTAQYTSVTPERSLDDIASLQLRHASGTLSTVLASWVLGGGYPGIRLRLHGSRGCVEAGLGTDTDGVEHYRRWTATGELVDSWETTLEPVDRAAYVRRHLSDLFAAMHGRPTRHRHTLPTLDAAAHVQEVLDAALSATTTTRVIGGRAPSSDGTTP